MNKNANSFALTLAEELYSEHKTLARDLSEARRYDRYAAQGLRKTIKINKANRKVEKHVKSAKKSADSFYDEAYEQNTVIDQAVASGPVRIAEILTPLEDEKDFYDYTSSAFDLISAEENLPPYIHVIDGEIIIDGYCLDIVNTSGVGMHGYEEWRLNKQRAVIKPEGKNFRLEFFNCTDPKVQATDAHTTMTKRVFKSKRNTAFSALSALQATDEATYESSPAFIDAITPDNTQPYSSHIMNDVLTGKMPGIYGRYMTPRTSLFN